MDRDLLLFLDTNAVLRMMIPVKGPEISVKFQNLRKN